MSINMSSIPDLLTEFNAAFYSDDFPAQFKIHQDIKKIADHKQEIRSKAPLEYLKFKDDLKLVRQVMGLIRTPDWSVVRQSETIKIESRGGGSNFITKSTILLDSNVFQVLSVLSEADLVTLWVEPLKEVLIYEQPTKTRYLLKYLFDFPWPLSNRHCVLDFLAVPIEKSVLIAMKTPTSSTYLGHDIAKPKRGETRMKVNMGGLFVEYISENQTRLTIVTSCDANISFLPNFIINFGTKHVLYYMMEEVRNKINNIKGSVYEERMLLRKDFYEYLRKMIGIYVH